MVLKEQRICRGAGSADCKKALISNEKQASACCNSRMTNAKRSKTEPLIFAYLRSFFIGEDQRR